MANTSTIGYGTTGFKGQEKFPGNKHKRTILIISLVVVALFLALWIWKAVQIGSIRESAKNDKEELRSNARQALITTRLDQLKLLAKPYAWAIRTALLQGNIDQVNQYANEMVREKGFQTIVVANKDGIVISSTNKKFEGKDFSFAGKRDYLTTDSIVVDRINDNLVAVSSPVMGLNNRLGTLLITCNIEIPGFLASDSFNKKP